MVAGEGGGLDGCGGPDLGGARGGWESSIWLESCPLMDGQLLLKMLIKLR